MVEHHWVMKMTLWIFLWCILHFRASQSQGFVIMLFQARIMRLILWLQWVRRVRGGRNGPNDSKSWSNKKVCLYSSLTSFCCLLLSMDSVILQQPPWSITSSPPSLSCTYYIDLTHTNLHFVSSFICFLYLLHNHSCSPLQVTTYYTHCIMTISHGISSYFTHYPYHVTSWHSHYIWSFSWALLWSRLRYWHTINSCSSTSYSLY